jgi:hypothetical protein
MKKMQIFETALCCPTGLCGVSVDPELLRITTVLNNLNKNGIEVNRYNLSNDPQMFIDNKTVNQFLNDKGIEGLPLTLLNEEVVITGRYPSNDEFVNLLNIPKLFIGMNQKQKLSVKVKKPQ